MVTSLPQYLVAISMVHQSPGDFGILGIRWSHTPTRTSVEEHHTHGETPRNSSAHGDDW